MHPSRPSATRRRMRRALTAMTVGVVSTMLLSTATAHADDASPLGYVHDATVTVTQTASYTATVTQPVTPTAQWGLPVVTQTVTGTATSTYTATSTQSATMTASGWGSTPDDATSAATTLATIYATIQAQANANTVAYVNANATAGSLLASAVVTTQQQLYAQALAAAKAIVAANTPAPSTTPDAAVSNCGATIKKANGTPWTCTFDDEFTGTKLNTSKWTTWNGVNYWSDKTMCYYNDASHLSVSGGVLNLRVTKLAANTSCTTPGGTTKPTYGGAIAYTKGAFSQAYGRFAARIRFAGGTGIHNDFWLYADGSAFTGQAETDIAESWGSLPDQMYGATHASGTSTSDAGATNQCIIPSWSSGFHTYAVEWTPTTITFIFDGYTCSSWTIPSTGLTNPAAFAQKMYMTLQVLADNGTDSPAPNASTTLPATMQVDWVRAWK